MSKTMIAVALLLAGCSSSAALTAPAPTACHKTDRHGTYLADYTQQSGTCGPITSMLIDLDDMSPKPGCTLSDKVWSENDCKTSGTVKCVANATTPALSTTLVIRQDTADGSVLSGLQTITIEGAGGCTSTYDLHLTRK